MSAPVVRFLRRDNEGVVREVGVVVWFGATHIIPTEEAGDEAIHRRLLRDKVGGEEGVLEPDAGPAYVRAMPQSFVGSRFWAVSAGELSDEEADMLVRRAGITL